MSTSLFAEALGWTLIHSLWHSLLIFAALRLVLALLPHAPAALRYRMAGTALAGIFLWAVVTFVRQWSAAAAAEPALTISAVLPAAGPTAAIHLVSTPDTPGPGGGWLLWMDALYALGLLFSLLRIGRDVMAMIRIRRSRVCPFDDAWEKYLARLADAWDIRRKIGLYISEQIDVPLVIGHLKPVIYLPFTLVNHLEAEQIEAILLHELGHIRRDDYLINILQTVAEALLFFNPLVWWISAQLRSERERCCDDLVLSQTQPQPYAEALLALEEHRQHHGRFVLAATGDRQHLLGRIRRIMERKTYSPNALQKLMVWTLLAGSLISVAWLTPAREPQEEMPNPLPVMARALDPVLDTVPSLEDTARLPAQPPAPRPAAAPPVAPASALPPPPPVPPMDSIAIVFDSTGAGAGQSFHWAFDGDSSAWKKFQLQMNDFSAKMKDRFQGEDWKKWQKDMEEYGRKMQEYYRSAEGQAYLKQWQKHQEQMQKWFHDDAWKAHEQALRNHARAAQEQVRKIMKDVQVAYAGARAPYQFSYGFGPDGGSSVAERIVNGLRRDGLLKDSEHYKLRLNANGLFVDGKRMDAAVFEKYRRLAGPGTTLEVKKKGSSTQTVVTQNENK